MPITFTCECGEKISVPDGMEGRIALCASCRRMMPIPGRERAEENDAASVSGLFREALAEFGESKPPQGGERADRGVSEASPASEADTRRIEAATAGDASGKTEPKEPPTTAGAPINSDAAPGGSGDASPPGPPAAPEERVGDLPAIPDAEEIIFADEVEDAEDAEDADGSEDAHVTSEVPVSAAPPSPPGPKEDAVGGKPAEGRPAPPRKPRPKTKDALPVEYAAKVIEQREIRKAIRREGEPDSPAGAYEPKDVELHGNVMKFHCRCGKRISVPVDAKKTIGRCPKCGARLVVPKLSQAKLPIPEPEPESKPKAAAGPAPKKAAGPAKKGSSDNARAKNVRRATDDVADRLRKKKPKRGARGPSPSAKLASRPAAPVARVVAGVADLGLVAAVVLGSAYAFGGGQWTGDGVVPAAVLGGGTWCANRIVVQWILGSSVGMMLAGLRLARGDGRPASFGWNLVRAVAGVLLLPLAPVAMWDDERRTPADRAAGTVILSDR